MKRIFLILLAVFFAFPFIAAGKDSSIPVMRSICLLKSQKGSGSGFFSRWLDQDVVITNNHVLLEMPDVRIMDVNGNEYQYDVAFVSKDRDLAIIPVKRNNQNEMPNLVIHSRTDVIDLNSSVNVFGDSLGDGVIVCIKGNFLGIGPEIIEVSAQFVPGNSGGPVIDAKSGMVIGVATFCRIIKGNRDALAGSRFEPGLFNPAIRRFATRIDNLDFSKFETVTKEEFRMDQNIYFKTNEIYEEIIHILSTEKPRTDRDMRRVINRLTNLLKDINIVLPPDQNWKTTYLRTETKTKIKMIKAVSDVLFSSDSNVVVEVNPDEEEIKQIIKSFSDKFKFMTSPALTKTCPKCKGSGKETLQYNPLESDRKNQSLLSIGKTKKCSFCEGKKQLLLRKSKKYVILPKGIDAKIAKKIKIENTPVCGLKLGSMVPDIFSFSNKYYKRRLKATEHSGMYTVYRFSGNHFINEAKETRFWFLGKILMRIDIILNMNDQKTETATIETLEKEYSVLKNAVYSGTRLSKIKPFEEILKKEKPKSSLSLTKKKDEWKIRHEEERRLQQEKYELQQGIAQLKEAAEKDLFCLYMPIKYTQQYPALLQISFAHKQFKLFQKISDDLEKPAEPEKKGISFSGAGKK